ncbi:oligoendopeptidase F [Helcococcus kunzii]|uniref:Oligopeptidase F n=1 Tax=Helcococcus kunzii ATCC 51366 TaxID=883114 RepID=H3NPT8_9FIRM|nr:oligoendopeptidase F [Helcococcus kunzii]EHR33316.1 oligoendopeptidase F [Helcococcus kunzii ATCC 51366]MCT1795972.1 oligoendopeptidase F [Helcococcus kunzii]MCT1988252.1 oligoendopeptidase F [Helcococcus kunzii]QUY65256.1 oligoendopeptidase F [Helcococcus kunzii]
MKREEAKLHEKWDMSLIFETEEKYEAEVESYKSRVDDFVNKYKDKLDSKEKIENSLRDLIKLAEMSSIMGAYAGLQTEVDAFDEKAQERLANLRNVFAEYDSKLSFYENELLTVDNAVLETVKENEDFKVFVEDLLDRKAHTLESEVEKALSKLSNVLSFPYKLYNDTKFRDINFPDVEVNGKKYPLSYNIFEGEMEYENDTDLRREAFRVFSETIRKYQHTTASTYNAQVQKEKTMVELRNYKDVFDYNLSYQKVSRDLYDRQMDIIMEELSPHMRRYANVLKAVHGLDEIRYSDLKIEVDPNYSPSVSYEDAKKYVLDGLSALGEDYLAIIKEAFDNRWIDYANNDGKSTGAFCSSPYGVPSYVCMTFNNKMSDVMTLAHELGHAGHFQLTHMNQNILNSDPSMYFVESPSTTNELLVENYLLDLAEKNNDKRMKRWVLSQMVAKTYYHNFVTHLLEAWYQREVYKLVEDNKQLNANILNKIFKETLEKFWGSDVVLDEGAELTWMRQPHYYMGLYSYTYSAGLTIGTQVSQNIRKNGKESADKWIEVLKMGGTRKPVELAKAAGVDVSTDEPLKNTIAFIGSLIKEIEEISIELGEM